MAENTKSQTGEKNPNWKGGRVVSSNGYILVRVGVEHHLSDVRGYAYEHRLVAEEKLGRELVPGEIVHHINGDKQDNRECNLKVITGNAEHFYEHRGSNSKLRKPGEGNPMVYCECGCGESFEKYDKVGRPRRFVNGHNAKGRLSLLQETILGFVLHFPITTTQAREYTGATSRDVSRVFQNLKKRGAVHRNSGGSWTC